MLSVPSRSPKRCRHTVWPVEVVAAPGGDIGVAREDLAMGRPHAADRLMALSNPVSWRNASGTGSKIVW